MYSSFETCFKHIFSENIVLLYEVIYFSYFCCYMYYQKTCYDCVWDGPECWHGTGIKTKLNTDFFTLYTAEVSCTRDVDAIIFDVHFVQAGLSGSVLDSNSAVLVVCDVRLGHLA